MSYPEWILERAFGGSDVADTPESRKSTEKWAEGRSMPASREACDLLVEACAESGSNSTLLFLVGGAGNGKSHLAGTVARGAGGKLLGDPVIHAKRVYDYLLPSGRVLKIVNDATIPPAGQWESDGNALRSDIDTVVQSDGHLLCCVNRGVLLRETLAAGTAGDCGYSLLRWLATPGSRIAGLPEGWTVVQHEGKPACDHYGFARLERPAAGAIDVHVVFMDNPSLLEPFPATRRVNGDARLDVDGRTVLAVTSLTESPRRMVAPAIQQTVSNFLDEIVDDGAAQATDPVRANAQLLSSTMGVDSFANIARAAEIISGTHFTYRDLWGLASLSVTGVVQGNSLRDHARWIQQQQLAATSENQGERLDAMLRLASLRTHQVMFSAGTPAAASSMAGLDLSYPTAQALRSLKLADPVRSLDRHVRDTYANKLFLLEEHALPGRDLAVSDERFAACWTDFDHALEEAIVNWLHREETPGTSGLSRKQVTRRRLLVSWYGEYIARLLSFSRGLPAFPFLVSLWQYSWKSSAASAGGSNLPPDIQTGLLELAFPSTNGRGALPVFDEHIVPSHEGPVTARVLVEVSRNDYRVKSTVKGDRVMVTLRHDEDAGASEILLDFPLLREIMARKGGHGFTEAMFDVEPRIERVRARGVMLAAGNDVSQVRGKLVFERSDQSVSSGLEGEMP